MLGGVFFYVNPELQFLSELGRLFLPTNYLVGCSFCTNYLVQKTCVFEWLKSGVLKLLSVLCRVCLWYIDKD